MFLLVEGYHREPAQSVGRIIATHAVTEAQLSGAILRLMRTGSNTVVVTEISEAVFTQYYQEMDKHNAQLKDER